ncbi:hypothetical protein K2F40_06335 [Clostridium sp. CM028]|uniref:hypothetical protein n=1 Tax=unclassified Clostridium TaxID=2614128 RepID=UPI001C0CE690|nr:MULTISPECIES: hypothetical protein [unclassified Clostridium]MBU3093030.1 hypothetical protein [Clostridium sp. CF011]MBW9148580.1 hypothetical protein [Clostridium sp. CM028]WAG69087.1 hypothetical protein LL036_13790 [Clostridium sp. CF011]WLC60822.1 hypothetical protein KTC94_11825 [Clostridium sp. CM028]
MEIEESKKINCIIINNPVQSDCLCIINHLVCKSEENKNIAHLIIANEDKQLENITNFGSLNIGYEYNIAEAYGNLEIDTVNIEKNREVDMLDEHFLIILPGGNIHIKLENPQEKMILQISVGHQVI